MGAASPSGSGAGAPTQRTDRVGHTSPYRGDIWLASLPAKPDDIHQPRSVLAVSTDERNARAGDVLVVPIFSRGRLGPLREAIPRGEGDPHHGSVLFRDQITCIETRFLHTGPLGNPVSDELLNDVIDAIQAAIGLDPWL